MLGTTTMRRCALLVMLLGFTRIAQVAPAADADLQLRYVAPATSFNEALPLGNGRMGVIVFGAVAGRRQHSACLAPTPAQRMDALAKAPRDRDTAMRVAWATGEYSYTQIAAHFGVHLPRSDVPSVGPSRCLNATIKFSLQRVVRCGAASSTRAGVTVV